MAGRVVPDGGSMGGDGGGRWGTGRWGVPVPLRYPSGDVQPCTSLGTPRFYPSKGELVVPGVPATPVGHPQATLRLIGVSVDCYLRTSDRDNVQRRTVMTCTDRSGLHGPWYQRCPTPITLYRSVQNCSQATEHAGIHGPHRPNGVRHVRTAQSVTVRYQLTLAYSVNTVPHCTTSLGLVRSHPCTVPTSNNHK